MDDLVFWRKTRGFSILAVACILSACGDGMTSGTVPEGGVSAPETPAAPSTPAGTNAAPVITGTIPTVAAVGKQYTFTPKASDPDRDALQFTISGQPRWASFDAKTGRMWGTPQVADVGAHEDIVVAVTDGKATSALPESIVVVKSASGGTGTGDVAVTWQAPLANTDGTQLKNLTGYRIHVGSASRQYTRSIAVNDAGLTRFVVENLPAGTYYFAVSAVAAAVESDFSTEANANAG